MKMSRTLVLLPLALLLMLGACGGTVSSENTIESKEGAVTGFDNPLTSILMGSFECGGTQYKIGANITTDMHWSNGYSYSWETKFRAINWVDNYYQGYTWESLVAGYMKMTPGMDGPYHVLYNTAPITGYFALNSTDPIGPRYGTIPAYGIYIYSGQERSDYPNGVMVVTVDLFQNCSKRIQFAVPL